MLVLTRKKGERVIIGRQLEVIVLEIRGNRVKLGFRGPPDVPIHRHELYCRISDPHPAAGCAKSP